jgi:hypothetical protein
LEGWSATSLTTPQSALFAKFNAGKLRLAPTNELPNLWFLCAGAQKFAIKFQGGVSPGGLDA